MKTIRSNGFTIVELLIVIVVIAVLAAISVVAYNGVQSRSRDSRRLSDIAIITKALKLYQVDKSTVMPQTHNSPIGWETSDYNLSDFLTPLKSNGYVSSVPLDPSNTATKSYYYYVYSAGSYGCDAAKGNYYIFGVLDMETTSNPAPTSPGFSCSSRNWQTEFEWVTGGFDRP